MDRSIKKNCYKMGWYMIMNKDIYELLIQLDANKSKAIQENAIEELKKEKDLNIFLQSLEPLGKTIWENCASILCSKTDDELIPYIKSLLEWLQDMNWPGAWQILERIEKIPKEKY